MEIIVPITFFSECWRFKKLLSKNSNLNVVAKCSEIGQFIYSNKPSQTIENEHQKTNEQKDK
jgi:hypothetical protein